MMNQGLTKLTSYRTQSGRLSRLTHNVARLLTAAVGRSKH
jgi:hypothetical protein